MTPLHGDAPGIDVVITDPAAVGRGYYRIEPPTRGSGSYFLLPGAHYSWRISFRTPGALVTAGETGWSSWSARESFSTPRPDGSSIFVSNPTAGSTIDDRTPAISWIDDNPATFYYEVQVSADPEFGDTGPKHAVYWVLVHGGESQPVNTWIVPDEYPLGPGLYYVRVRPRVQATPAGARETGVAWSRVSSFFVGNTGVPRAMTAPWFVEPRSNARRQGNTWRASRPEDAAELGKIARQPQAVWFGDWSPNVEADVARHVTSSAAAGARALLVAYNIPLRDCGSYSGGGATSPGAYREWVRSFARGIGSHHADVVLEPDALPQLDCLPDEWKRLRLDLIRDAVSVLSGLPNVALYIDIGNPEWLPVSEAVIRLQQAGVNSARGFSLNVSNFFTTEDNVAYGRAIATVTGKHFVIDTSRNGLGPTLQRDWCNPEGRALGRTPTRDTGDPLVDAFLWVKRPGESDGTCNGGPPAGTWWPEYALGLARRAPD